MANHLVYVSYEREVGIIVSPKTRRTVKRGDTVTFTHSPTSGKSSITISQFSSSVWTNVNNLSLSKGASSTKTFKSNATLGFASVSCSGGKYAYFSIISSTDTTPDPFELGPSHTDVSLNQLFYSYVVNLAGINSGTLAKCTNGTISVNDGTPVSSKTVYNGDKIVVRAYSAATYGTLKVVTLDVGGVRDSFTIKTIADPISSGKLISINKSSAPISFSQVAQFFGRPVDPLTGQHKPVSMSGYYRGGENVPNISQNNAIATSGTLSLKSFLKSYTSLYFKKLPDNKTQIGNTKNGNIYLTCSFQHDNDWMLGYGKDLINQCQIRYTVTLTQAPSGKTINDVTINSKTGYHNSWKQGNSWISLRVLATRGNPGSYSGVVKIEIRHPNNTSQIVSANAGFYFTWFDNQS